MVAANKETLMSRIARFWTHIDPVVAHVHSHTMALSSNKIFIGIAMILLNVGSKVVSIELSSSCQEYLKQTYIRFILLFCISFMGTRDIVVALVLTIGFVLISDVLLNEESPWCVVPHTHRVLHTLPTDAPPANEVDHAIQVLERAKQAKAKEEQHTTFMGHFTH